MFRDGAQVGTSATTSFGYTGLTCSTTYALGVAAVDAAGNVSGTAIANVATAACPPPPPPDTTPPSTPTSLTTSSVGQTSASLSWTASTDNVGVTGYRLFLNGNQVGAGTATSFGYTGLACGQAYTLGVAAVDAVGNVSGTATTSITTTACADTTAPSSPTGLSTSSVGQTSTILSWTASTDNVGVTGYRLFQNGTQVGAAAGTSYSYTGLTCGTTYTLGVAAADAAGNTSAAATKSVTTAACSDTTAPSAPTGLATSAVSQTGATLSWTASTDNVAVTGYRTFMDGSQDGTPASTSYGFTGLTCGTTYTLGVAAVDAAGNASSIATKSVTTAACPDTTAPSTPTGLATSAVTQTGVTLSWTASTDNVAVTGYRTFRDGTQARDTRDDELQLRRPDLRHDLHPRRRRPRRGGQRFQRRHEERHHRRVPRHDCSVGSYRPRGGIVRADVIVTLVERLDRQCRSNRLPALPERQPGRHLAVVGLHLRWIVVWDDVHARSGGGRRRRKHVGDRVDVTANGSLLERRIDGQRVHVAVRKRFDVCARRQWKAVRDAGSGLEHRAGR